MYYNVIIKDTKGQSMTKRLALFALCFILILSILPITALATERYEIMKIGDEDTYVEQLQQKLKDLGYFPGRTTGYYGTVTQQAVIEYQDDHDLVVDGKAGPKTLTSLMGDDYQLPPDRFVNDDESADKYYPGDKGDEIHRIQERLKVLEYYDYSTITGYYGPMTENAIKRFQRTNELTEDGIAGPATLSLLYSDNAKYFCIYPGDRGDDVQMLQEQLKELGYYVYPKITGYFGTVTEDALKEFQLQCGLTADAKAGKNTRARLFADDAPQWDGQNRTGDEDDEATPPPETSSVDRMLSFADEHLDKKYVYSTEGPNTFDCSGFVYYVLQYMGVYTSRYSADGFSKVDSWEKITAQSALAPGDLLFFKSNSSSRISHTGIYIGNGEFIHASSSAGCVKISTMTSYYDRNFVQARRVF